MSAFTRGAECCPTVSVTLIAGSKETEIVVSSLWKPIHRDFWRDGSMNGRISFHSKSSNLNRKNQPIAATPNKFGRADHRPLFRSTLAEVRVCLVRYSTAFCGGGRSPLALRL